ncbi:hypothetical protein HK101_003008 [Irineochytrium annulatum]|nr:hypothetical protein HK101_003008 [Irineochytrium annulatum]
MSNPLLEIVRDQHLLVPQILTPLVGPKCASELIVLSPDTIRSPCASLFVSKGLGVGIIAGGAIVKVPQIFKIVGAGSAEGISIMSYILETLALMIGLAYNVRGGNPFSTYGETAFITIQNVIISLLILVYNKSYLGMLLFLVNFSGVLYALFTETIVTHEILLTLQWLSIVAGTVSKVPQIFTNFSTGSTGQLSFITMALQSLGSAARIFTTLREVDDPVILLGCVVAAALNAVLFAQVIWYMKPSRSGAPPKPSASPAAKGGKGGKGSPGKKKVSKAD